MDIYKGQDPDPVQMSGSNLNGPDPDLPHWAKVRSCMHSIPQVLKKLSERSCKMH
jgi:hypothetical protein